uniref:Proline dehydrogenase n=1 Tax=Cyprinodon variegatus TaxID=28743 RepID=A0A3Q2EI72_CYPVA
VSFINIANHGPSWSRAKRPSACLHYPWNPCDYPWKCGKAWGGRRNFSSPANKISVDFEQSQEAYRSKDSLKLLRSLVVFHLCSYDILVDNNKGGNQLDSYLVGSDLFNNDLGQFVAWDDHISIKPLIQMNQAFGIGSILVYNAVEDISPKEENLKEEYTFFPANISADETKCMILYVIPCNYYLIFFFLLHYRIIARSIGGSSMDCFSAVKMTALGQHHFLLHFSEVLMKRQQFFKFLASQQGKDAMKALEQRMELQGCFLVLQELMIKLGAKGESEATSAPTLIPLVWIHDDGLISCCYPFSLFFLFPQLSKLEPVLQMFTVEDEKQLKRTLQRLDVLAKYLFNGDKEQAYFQPAISKLMLDSQRIYNIEKAVTFNTYQCSLKEAYNKVAMDVELSERVGGCFAAKLMCGAYMFQEQERAKKLQYEELINPDYGSTSRMYHRCLYYVLDEIALNRKANVMVTRCFRNCANLICLFQPFKMKELGPLPTENKVFFGQLLGMCDQISFPLGFSVYKYFPFGPVSEVMPYLSQRARENQGFFERAQKDRLWNQLKLILVSGGLLYRPVY